jgi:DNA-directed RNA polymerase specialized sigma24 family protein
VSAAGRPPGDVSRAVGEMFDAHANVIHQYAARRLGPDAAEDVVAEVFAIALDRFHTFTPLKGTERG